MINTDMCSDYPYYITVICAIGQLRLLPDKTYVLSCNNNLPLQNELIKYLP